MWAPKISKKTKGRNLLENLARYRERVLPFCQYEEVPFTNNQVEQDFRPVKIKTKVNGGWRTPTSAQQYVRIRGFIWTVRKQALKTFDQLYAAQWAMSSIVTEFSATVLLSAWHMHGKFRVSRSGI